MGLFTYSSEGFLDHNLDSLNPNFILLLRGSIVGAADGAEGAGRFNPFIKSLFFGKAIVTQAHPKDEDTIVSVQQPVKPMRAPSTHLCEHFMADNIYTSTGSSSLVAVNPHKYVASNADSILQKYAAGYRDMAENEVPLPPHIFQLSNSAYYHMRRTAQDQSLIIRYALFLVL